MVFCDRDGRSRPPQKAGNGKRVRKGQRSDLRRQEWEELSGSCSGPAGKRRRKRRSSSRATRLLGFFGTSVSKAGRKSGYPKKGRGTSDGFGHLRDFGSECSQGPGRKVERPANLREAQSGRPVGLLRKEGVVRSEATPELVSQDRERVGRPQGFIFQVTNTGRSFARRSGGWQQCRPPFLLGARRCRLGLRRPSHLAPPVRQPLRRAPGTAPPAGSSALPPGSRAKPNPGFFTRLGPQFRFAALGRSGGGGNHAAGAGGTKE